jgi:hypothetical protein
MFLLQFTARDEHLKVRWRDEPEPPRPAGSLAAEILQTLNTQRSGKAARQRLLQWGKRLMAIKVVVSASGDRVYAGQPDQSQFTTRADKAVEDALRIVAAQLQLWATSKRARWRYESSGPMSELLLRDIHWHGPADGKLSEIVAVGTPEAAVFMSALHGTLRGTLIPCLSCRRLSVQPKGGRLKRCPHCLTRRGVPASVHRAYTLARDRTRKNPDRYGDDALKRLDEIRQESEHGLLAAEAIAKCEAVAPITTKRGRPRKRR